MDVRAAADPDDLYLAAPCGLACGLCPLNRALSDENLRQALAKGMGVPADKVGCPGCRAVDGHCPVIGEQCATYVCAQTEAVAFCSDCVKFPCPKLAPCAERADKLPHNLKAFSLSLRRAHGPEAWEKAIRGLYGLYFKGQMVIGRGPALPGEPGAKAGLESA